MIDRRTPHGDPLPPPIMARPTLHQRLEGMLTMLRLAGKDEGMASMLTLQLEDAGYVIAPVAPMDRNDFR